MTASTTPGTLSIGNSKPTFTVGRNVKVMLNTAKRGFQHRRHWVRVAFPPLNPLWRDSEQSSHDLLTATTDRQRSYLEPPAPKISTIGNVCD